MADMTRPPFRRQALVVSLLGLVGLRGEPPTPLKLPANWNPRDPLPIEKIDSMKIAGTVPAAAGAAAGR